MAQDTTAAAMCFVWTGQQAMSNKRSEHFVSLTLGLALLRWQYSTGCADYALR